MKSKKKQKKFVAEGIELEDLHKDIIQDLLKASKSGKRKDTADEKDKLHSKAQFKKMKNAKKKKKKQKFLQTAESSDIVQSDDEIQTKRTAHGLFGNEFRLDDCDKLSSEDGTGLSLPIKQKVKKEVEVIVFEDPAKRNKEKKASISYKEIGNLMDGILDKTHGDADDDTLFKMRQAKFDVFKYYVNGLNPQEQEKEEVQMQQAIKLGAKPPKKKHVSIKEYVENKQKFRKEEADTSESSVKKKKSSQRGREVSKDPRRKRSSKDRYTDGQIGQYRNGVLHIPKEHLPSQKKQKI